MTLALFKIRFPNSLILELPLCCQVVARSLGGTDKLSDGVLGSVPVPHTPYLINEAASG